MSIDPITIEVVTNRIREIAGSMEHALYHSGYSPILRESKDGTAGLADAQGRVVFIGGGLQYHSLGYEQAVRSVLARYPRETLRPGDSFIVNDPYLGGNPHAPDMVAVTPGFHRDALIGYGVSIAHKADIGGLVPGSSGAAAREIYHDGILIPPVRYRSAEGINEAVEAILRNNSRVPDVVLGDLRGQVGATRVGVERLAALCDEYGAPAIRTIMSEILTRTARRVRAEIAEVRDGVAEAEGFLDHDGAVKDRPVRIHVVAEKRGDRLRLDFTGSSPQTRGPVNVLAWTAKAGSLLALIAATDPTIPVNSGIADAVEFVFPPGSVVDPQRPATVNLYFPGLHLIYNCVLAALGQLNPARAVAPSGLGTGALAIGYRRSRSDKPAVQYELLSTALGATSAHDGAPMVQAMNHITPGTPVEVLESEYPVRVRRFDVRCDSAGPGTYRGGVAYVREYEMLEDAILTVRTTNQRYTAWGLAGGKSPAPARATLNPDGPRHETLEPIVTRELVTGDVVSLELSGGGGYGDPYARDPDAVLADVRNGYVSLAAAAEAYGVAIDPRTLDIDANETARLRSAAAPFGGTTRVG
jgi:N-methylhydantoinase B